MQGGGRPPPCNTPIKADGLDGGAGDGLQMGWGKAFVCLQALPQPIPSPSPAPSSSPSALMGVLQGGAGSPLHVPTPPSGIPPFVPFKHRQVESWRISWVRLLVPGAPWVWANVLGVHMHWAIVLRLNISKSLFKTLRIVKYTMELFSRAPSHYRSPQE